MTASTAPSPAAGRTSASSPIAPSWRRSLLRSWPLRIAVFLICFLWFLPTLGLLVTSFREPIDITRSGWWEALLHPFDLSQWTLQNYANVITADGMAGAFINSLIVAIPATVIPITVAAFAAYAFAWMRFPLRATLFIIVVGLLVVPLQMALIPVLRIYSGMGIAGTFLGVWLAHTGFGLPLAVFLLYNFISQLPEDLFETASIDGATHFQMFTKIVLPLTVPALAAFAIFQFMWVWNDLLVALVFLGPQDNVAVATVKLYQMIGNRGQAWHLLTAGAFITMVLPLLVFLALQRYFVRGLLAGSVKG
jgi:alpha-glucoside transport system permease protein